MDGDELRPVREGAFNLHLVHQVGDAVHHVGAPEKLPAQVHQLGDRAPVADELENLRRDQRDRLRMIELQPAREPFLREDAGLMQRELV